MKVLMLGAGGIGCYYAARLLEANHSVVLVARGAHLEAMQSKGMVVKHPSFEFHQPVTAVDTASLMQQFSCDEFDLICLTLKATVTKEVMAELADWLNAGEKPNKAPVWSLQNGVDNEQMIADVVGMERTLGGLAVRIGGHIIEPGVVEATGPAQLELGAWPNHELNSGWRETLDEWAILLGEAQIPVTVSDDIQASLWRKLVINNGVNPLSALALLSTRPLTRHPTLTLMVKEMMDETVRAAQQIGVGLTADDADAMYKLICEFDDIKTSMQVDREKGRTMELDDICMPVIRNAEASGQPAQTTERVYHLLKANLLGCAELS
ncbi:MAG: ketopantoate reductase family protein [Oceanobacter sp.]